MGSRSQVLGASSHSRTARRGRHPAIIILSAALALACSKGLPAQAQPAPAAHFAVVLDAAHGGSDTGGNLSSDANRPELEKTYALALSVRLRSLLAARGITVATTRESDSDVDDQRRAEVANHAQAQACLTLHASATGTGIHLFLSSLPPAQPARFLPWKTAQASYVNRSVALAGILNSALTHAGVKVTIGRTALTSIDSMTCPAVAVEIAPQKNADGTVTSLDDPAYQANIATAISAGLLEWRQEPRQP